MNWKKLTTKKYTLNSKIKNRTIGLLLLIICWNQTIAQLPKHHGKIQTNLYLGDSCDQPLVVFFGGSEGGNVWAGDNKKAFRDKLTNQGYAVLAIGYFGLKKIPKQLDRISIDAIADSIIQIAKHPLINNKKIALVAGSRGSELILNLASRYKQIKAVVAITPSHVTFPYTTQKNSTSSWTYLGKEIPAIQVNSDSTVEKGWPGIFKAVVNNQIDMSNALINVEHINGPVLLISAKNDNVWPYAFMAKKIIERLEANNFEHYYNHISISGDHGELAGHLDMVFEFLNTHFDIK